MTGPEHYKLAEFYSRQAEEAHTAHTGEPATGQEGYLLQQAILHATLAHAAATALTAVNTVSQGPGGTRFYLTDHDDREEWAAVVTIGGAAKAEARSSR